eukprot:CAMPEP_0178657430 /NCGR_PEP_ID=MMETSP0698-20121128/25381_1 /TAXON_ID=265572 /ORGANISM="Extubocellulus spinifer, Strain CCMP396" /LENGTH=319 /DNA_ID=CAMNT_0020299607 /DNA_START=80 /DNA_END=1035 /DNA_ORIENTATION=+
MPPGRGRGRGPGRGPGPGRAVARHHHRMAAANAAAAQPPAQAEPQKKEEEEDAGSKPKEAEKISYSCEFPRCEKPSEYGFKEEGSYPQFCSEHKSDDMILLVPDPDNPKDSSLQKVRQYKKMEPGLKELEDAPAKADACKAEIQKVTTKLHREESDIASLTKALAELNAGLASQEKKPKRKFGKGHGLMFQDQGEIDRLTAEKADKEGRVVKVKTDREINQAKLEQLKTDLKPLAKDAAEYASTKKAMDKLKADAVDDEASGLYLQLKAKGMTKQMNEEGDVIFARLMEKALIDVPMAKSVITSGSAGEDIHVTVFTLT